LSKRPILRGTSKAREGLYQLGEFPNDVIVGIGRLIVHRLAVGHADITGDDFAGIFANAISGEHRASPLGITDVTWNSCSWSAKTVHSDKPFTVPSLRLISGRNSPKYSYGIKDVFEDLEATGEAILNIWNERVNQSLNEYDDLRIVVLVRNMSRLEFTLFEYEATRYLPKDYAWVQNAKSNLEGIERATDEHRFTWQPHGSQFTVIKDVPPSAYRFRIKKHPGFLDPQLVLNLVHFDEKWIERVDENGDASPHAEGSGD